MNCASDTSFRWAGSPNVVCLFFFVCFHKFLYGGFALYVLIMDVSNIFVLKMYVLKMYAMMLYVWGVDWQVGEWFGVLCISGFVS